MNGSLFQNNELGPKTAVLSLTYGDIERLIWFIDSSLPEYEAQGTLYEDLVGHMKIIKQKLEARLP